MKMTRTNNEWLIFTQVAENYIGTNAEETKFNVLLRKQIKAIGKALDGYNDKIEDARINHCQVDDKGTILRDAQGGYVFTKDGLKGFLNARKQLLSETMECNIYIQKENLDLLQPKYAEYFNEFISREQES